MLKRFIPEFHYEQGLDACNGLPYVFLMNTSRQLISQYYMEKYGCEIFLLGKLQTLPYALANLDKTRSPYRAGFFVGNINDHAIPFIYLRENGEEALLYADSQGHNPQIFSQLKERIALPIYSIQEKRQGDPYSCAVDTLIFLRDGTALNKDRNNYRLPHLLTDLKERAKKKEDYLQAKLPNVLLKTAQQSSFMLLHQENSNQAVHKQESLKEFRERYSLINSNGKLQSTYPRIKGLKIAHMVEIQFYLNQLKTQLASQWTVDLKAAFIKQAKFEFTLQGDFFLNPQREGLHKLATEFLEKIKQNKQDSLLNRTAPSPIANINKIQHIAETLLQIIEDSEYWKQKSFWGLGVPDGIHLMQQELQACPSSTTLAAKIHRVRQIALDRRKSKSILFLLTGTEKRDSLTEDFYKIFSQEWLSTPLFAKICADWEKPRPRTEKSQESPPESPLPSQADYKRTRIRF